MMRPCTTQKKISRHALLRSALITLIYAFFGFLWIIGSDYFLSLLLQKNDAFFMISIYKGLAFVTATAALIFYLVFRNLRIVLRESEERSQSEARLLEAQRLSHIGNFEWNLQTNRIMVSQEILSIFEVEDRIPDFGVESFLNLVHPDDRQRVEEEVNIALHSNFDASFLFRILPKDGNPRHVLVRLAPQTGTEKRSCVLGTIQDITDRVQAENSAKENEAIYKAFINSSCDLIYLKDHKLRYVAVNKSMQQFYGLEEKQLFGKTSSQIFQTPDALRWEQRDKQVMETGSVIDAEDVENGGTFETIIFPVDLSDQRRGVGGISRDISQYKRSEAAAKQERDRAQTYFDIAAIMNVVLDMDGIVVNINQAGCAKIGMSKTEIIGKHWISNFVPRQEQMYVNGFFNEVSKSIFCSDEAFENDILTSAGEIRKIEWRNAILKDSEGVPYGVFSAGVDVTELRQAMRALNESERSKSVLLSNLPGMAYRCSCDHKWTMQFVSSGCYELTGYFPEDIIHNKIVSFDEIICEEYREPIWKESNAHFLTLSSNRYEYEILTSSGKRKWVLDINQGLFDEDGKIEALEGIIIDITESKKQFLEIQYLNDHDQLTGLYNRLYFDRVRDRMSLEQWSPLAIIHADINGLKLINDAFGNTTGDGIIQKTAGLLADTLKEGDILARVGGDEFAMLLTGASAQDPAERVREIQNKFDIYNETLADRTLLINLSIGWAEKQDSHSDLVQVEKDAESNLSRRKLLDQKSHHNAVLASIMATLFERSFETEEHAKRISALCEIVGKRVGLSHAEIDRLKLFAYLHDIGKIGVSDQILNKTTSLDEEELHQMKKHPEIGYRIAMSSPEFAPVAELILAHHERWDGNGYPDRLAGKEIPLLARILAVADAYDAMTQDRVYRRALSFQEALEEIRKNAGTQFDPEIARVFLEVLTEKGNELSDSPR